MGVRRVAITTLFAAATSACAHGRPDAASPRSGALALANCYEVTVHFDSSGVLARLHPDSIFVKQVRPDSSGLGSGQATWIDTLRLEAHAFRSTASDARGTRYRLEPRAWRTAWWQLHGDTVWVVMADGFIYARDSLLVTGAELHGVRTYATDAMQVIFAGSRYRPVPCTGGRAPAS